MAENISIKGANNPPFSARKAASSSSVGGISGVVEVDQSTEVMEQIEPKKKDAKTQ
jgi:hypothetical protein